jgi:hypothetical protein
MIRFHCPKCESQMEVDESFAGRAARCPTCGTNLKVPKKGEAPPSTAAKGPPPRPGAATIKVDGESVEVRPPMQPMVFVSMGFLGAAVAVLIVVGAMFYSWLIAGILGGVMSLMGTLIALPAYYNVKRSRGRKRGRAHALVCIVAGGGLFLACVAILLVSLVQTSVAVPCEDNLKRIDAALWAYADKHNGAFPPALRTLVDEKYITADVLICPAYRGRSGEETYSLTPDINVNNPLWPKNLMVVCDKGHSDGFVRILLLNHQITQKSVDEWNTYGKAQVEKWNEILNKIRNPKAEKKPEAPATPAPATPATPAPAAPAPAAPAAPAPATEGTK